MDLWSENTEMLFFQEASKFASPEQLFYKTDDGKYVAYWPKGYKGKKTTLQSRNALIGNYTEKWTRDLISESVKELGYFSIQGAICESLALPANSPGDVVISKKNNRVQNADDVLMIFEVKMSVVWNWLFDKGNYTCIGDFRTHQGNPGMLRSDSMLKAIGKSLNIRISHPNASKIPIIVLGNTPITEIYYKKVDFLKKTGIIQGFWSVNPNPISNGLSIKKTEKHGFYKFDDFESLKNSIQNLLKEDLNFFSSMKTKTELGQLIEIASKEKTYEEKAEKFLKLLRDNNGRSQI